ncbi:hypothetical protein DFH29DRAFT_936210 [Suillus ampliporus]|nr:hypothetical protein DFH29DRAFT_936210 [Suillus ampliporus]
MAISTFSASLLGRRPGTTVTTPSRLLNEVLFSLLVLSIIRAASDIRLSHRMHAKNGSDANHTALNNASCRLCS